MENHPECFMIQQRASKVLAGGPSTLSKHWSRFPFGISPISLSQGDGANVWCEDGGKFIDCIAGLGPLLLGHSHPRVLESVRNHLGRLQLSSVSTRLEVEVAEQLVGIIPGAEQCRFASNGADVTNAVIKLARYVTGKKHVLFIGYHGGHD
ncbi:MAG: aminotransferase class III-fold pyridoxal phosphate-dependent enzyme, partial [Patescibacteria group bacterium]